MSEIKNVLIKDIKVVENTRVHKDQELAYLMSSIKQDGLLQPIGINQNHRVLYGHRRFYACSKLGWNTIPAIVYDLKNETDMMILNIIENLQRRDVTPMELGRMCVELSKKLSPSEIQARLSISRSKMESAIAAYSNVPKSMRDKITFFAHGKQLKKGRISASVAITATGMRRKYNLNRNQLVNILEEARKKELSNVDLQIVAALMQQGFTVKQAMQERKKYVCLRCEVVVAVEELNALAKKAGLSNGDYIRSLVYGQNTPLKKPSFYKKGQKA